MKPNTLLMMLLSFLLFAALPEGRAQTTANRVRLGLMVGPEFTSRAHHELFSSVSFSPRLGYAISAIVMIPLGQHFGVIGAAGFAKMRYQWRETDWTDSNFLTPRNLYSVSKEESWRLGALCRYAFQKQDNGLFLSLGPELEMVHRLATTFVVYEQGVAVYKGRMIPGWSPLLVSAQVSVGYLWKFREKIGFSIEPYGRYGNFRGFEYFWSPFHHISGGLRLGCWF